MLVDSACTFFFLKKMDKVLINSVVALLFLVHMSQVMCAQNSEDDAALVAVETEDADKEIPVSDGVGIKFTSDTDDPNVEVFKPTKEWQTVKKNQPIPKGLHVRYNLQSGHVEAKLLDENDPDVKEEDKEHQDEMPEGYTGKEHGESRLQHMKKAVEDTMSELENTKPEGQFQHWKSGDKEGIVNLKKQSFSKEELKEALKKLKDRDDEKAIPAENRKFRSMDEIKKELQSLQADMKTDLEILQQLLREYKDEDLSEERRVHYLSEFENYLHQIDNAINFVDLGGFDLVVKDLNHTSEEVRRGAALVIGSSTQSNPKVQVHAMKSGVLQKLIRMVSIEPTNTLRLRVLYAISCILRHFPYAQQEFVNNGGVQVLTEAFKQHGTDKLRLKAITLAIDLFEEQESAEKHADIENPEQFEKLQQYRSIPLRSALLDNGWCDVVPELLAIQEHDTREKVLYAMKYLTESCPIFVDDRWRLIALRKQYIHLSEEEALEEPEGYFHGLLKLIEELLGKLEHMHKNLMKDEL